MKTDRMISCFFKFVEGYLIRLEKQVNCVNQSLCQQQSTRSTNADQFYLKLHKKFSLQNSFEIRK